MVDRSILLFERMIKLFKDGRYIPWSVTYVKFGRAKKELFVLELSKLFLWLIILLDNKLAK